VTHWFWWKPWGARLDCHQLGNNEGYYYRQVRRIGWCAPRERQTADAICLILGSDDLQKELAENALSYMYKGFDWHIVSEKYTQIATFIVIQDETINESRHDKK
jgi:hypothetical protein